MSTAPVAYKLKILQVTQGRSRSFEITPIIINSSGRLCVTMMSSEVCSVSKQLASTSFRRELLGKLLVRRWRDSSGNGHT